MTTSPNMICTPRSITRILVCVIINSPGTTALTPEQKSGTTPPPHLSDSAAHFCEPADLTVTNFQLNAVLGTKLDIFRVNFPALRTEFFLQLIADNHSCGCADGPADGRPCDPVAALVPDDSPQRRPSP